MEHTHGLRVARRLREQELHMVVGSLRREMGERLSRGFGGLTYSNTEKSGGISTYVQRQPPSPTYQANFDRGSPESALTPLRQKKRRDTESLVPHRRKKTKHLKPGEGG